MLQLYAFFAVVGVDLVELIELTAALAANTKHGMLRDVASSGLNFVHGLWLVVATFDLNGLISAQVLLGMACLQKFGHYLGPNSIYFHMILALNS